MVGEGWGREGSWGPMGVVCGMERRGRGKGARRGGGRWDAVARVWVFEEGCVHVRSVACLGLQRGPRQLLVLMGPEVTAGKWCGTPVPLAGARPVSAWAPDVRTIPQSQATRPQPCASSHATLAPHCAAPHHFTTSQSILSFPLTGGAVARPPLP